MTEHTTDPGYKSAADLEREAAEQRANVERTLETLQDRLSPGQIVDQLMDLARQSGGAEFGRNLGRSVRDNPMPIALVGVGLAWLMAARGAAAQGRSYRSDDHYYDDDEEDRWAYDPDDNGGLYPAGGRTGNGHHERSLGDKAADVAHGVSDTLSQAGEGIGNAAHRAGEGMGNAAHRAGEVAGSAAHRIGSTVHGVRRYGAQAGRHARRYGRQIRRGFFDTLQEQPLVLGAIGLALGAAIGVALPSTEREDEFLGETRDDLKRRAAEAGRGQVEKAQTVAGAAYKAAREEAAEQGLTMEEGKATGHSLKDKVTAVVDAGSQAASTEMERQRQDS